MTVDYAYTFALKIMRKTPSGFDATDFCAHFNDAQASYQDDLLGRFQAKNIGKEGANTGLMQNETVLTKLTPFIKPATLIISAGQAPKPNDFIYTLALRSNSYKVFSITHDKIWQVSSDTIDPPSLATNTFYYVEYQNYYYLLPQTLTGNITLDYIASPVDVFWNFTLDGNNRKVYASSGSVHPQWDSNSVREILKRMLKTLGVTYKDNDLVGFGTSSQTLGE